jgi:hypothetical protein
MAKQKPAEQEQQEEEAPAERLDRTQCADRVIAELDGETTLDDLAKKADALYVAGGGGKSNTDRANWEVWRSLQTAEALGLVETEEADIIVRRKKGK